MARRVLTWLVVGLLGIQPGAEVQLAAGYRRPTKSSSSWEPWSSLVSLSSSDSSSSLSSLSSSGSSSSLSSSSSSSSLPPLSSSGSSSSLSSSDSSSSLSSLSSSGSSSSLSSSSSSSSSSRESGKRSGRRSGKRSSQRGGKRSGRRSGESRDDDWATATRLVIHDTMPGKACTSDLVSALSAIGSPVEAIQIFRDAAPHELQTHTSRKFDPQPGTCQLITEITYPSVSVDGVRYFQESRKCRFEQSIVVGGPEVALKGEEFNKCNALLSLLGMNGDANSFMAGHSMIRESDLFQKKDVVLVDNNKDDDDDDDRIVWLLGGDSDEDDRA